jgi:hypothetical protein
LLAVGRGRGERQGDRLWPGALRLEQANCGNMQSRCAACRSRSARSPTSDDAHVADGARKLIYALRVLTASDSSLGSDEAS